MPNYRRNYVPGGTYFFTAVTYRRRPFLTTDLSRDCLREAMEHVRAKRPFEVVAIVLLPDHWHSIWTLPPNDADYSTRWRQIKEIFTRMFLARGGLEVEQSASRVKHAQRGVWQRRFWEHTVRDEDDLRRCADYIHWNPRKHQLVPQVQEWPWSSFHQYAQRGEYGPAWGREDPTPDYDTPEWA